MNAKRLEYMTDLIAAGMIVRADTLGLPLNGIAKDEAALEEIFKKAREIAEDYVEAAEEIEVLEP